MILRSYQSSAIDRVREECRTHRRVCMVAPTGSGKTVIAGSLIDSILRKGNRALFLAHRKELLDQPARLLSEMGHRFGMVRGNDRRKDTEAQLQIASVQTLARRDPKVWPEADLIILDECHRARAKTYETVLAHYSEATTIGLTATPQRLDGKGLGQAFGSMVVVAQKQDLIDQGYLALSRVFAPTVPDMSGTKTRAGDWAPEAVADIMKNPKIIGDVVEHWLKLARGRITMGFAASVEHAYELSQAFRMRGIESSFIDDKTPEGEREAALRDLEAGRLRILWNYGILVEGVDIPSVSCIDLCRPTKSLTIYLQACGRGDRLFPGKVDNLILDHGGCSLWHGLPTMDRAWALDMDRKKREGQCKVCPWCFAVVAVGVSRCGECGKDLPVADKGKRKIKMIDGELVEVGEDDAAILSCMCGGTIREVYRRGFRRKMECDRCRESTWETSPDARTAPIDARRREWERLEDKRREKQYKPGWSKWKYKALFGNWPSREVTG